jgi:hypothetical protein
MSKLLGPLERWMKLDCRTFTRLASENLDRPLTFGERFRYRLHRIICAICRQQDKRMQQLRDVVHEAAQSPVTASQEELPNEARERIRQRVAEELRR